MLAIKRLKFEPRSAESSVHCGAPSGSFTCHATMRLQDSGRWLPKAPTSKFGNPQLRALA